MFFDPLVSWIVPVFGFLFDKVDATATTISRSSKLTTNEPSYPEPHRDPKTGKIIIENSLLYKQDCEKYGSYQAWNWIKQGRYNLTPEEFEKEKERITKKYEYLDRL